MKFLAIFSFIAFLILGSVGLSAFAFAPGARNTEAAASNVQGHHLRGGIGNSYAAGKKRYKKSLVRYENDEDTSDMIDLPRGVSLVFAWYSPIQYLLQTQEETDGMRLRRDLAANGNGGNITAPYSVPSLVIPLARTVTTTTVSLVDSLKPFKNCEIPVEKMEEFMVKSLNIAKKIEMGNEATSEEAWNCTESHPGDLRRYNSHEINVLRMMRDAIPGLLGNGIMLLNRVGWEFRDRNDVDYDCEDMRANLGRTEDDCGEEGNLKIDPSNILAFECTNWMRVDAAEDLGDLIDSEIAKGEKKVSTRADFYLTALGALGSFIQGGNELASSIIHRNMFSHYYPLSSVISEVEERWKADSDLY